MDAVIHPARSAIAYVLAAVILLLFASVFGSAGRAARRVKPYCGKLLYLVAWGESLDPPPGTRFRLDSVVAIGAGLHLRFRPDGGGRQVVLKVAQPTGVEVTDDALVIRRAAYVQWSGKRLPGTTDEELPAVMAVWAVVNPPV